MEKVYISQHTELLAATCTYNTPPKGLDINLSGHKMTPGRGKEKKKSDTQICFQLLGFFS